MANVQRGVESWDHIKTYPSYDTGKDIICACTMLVKVAVLYLRPKPLDQVSAVNALNWEAFAVNSGEDARYARIIPGENAEYWQCCL